VFRVFRGLFLQEVKFMKKMMVLTALLLGLGLIPIQSFHSISAWTSMGEATSKRAMLQRTSLSDALAAPANGRNLLVLQDDKDPNKCLVIDLDTGEYCLKGEFNFDGDSLRIELNGQLDSGGSQGGTFTFSGSIFGNDLDGGAAITGEGGVAINGEPIIRDSNFTDSTCDCARFRESLPPALLFALGVNPQALARLGSSLKGRGTLHSNGKLIAVPGPAQTITSLLGPLLELSPAAAQRLFGSVFPCGAGPAGRTVCASSRPAPAGRYVFLIVRFDGDIPLDDPERFYQYAFVFDADGRTNNNFRPDPQFPNDLFAFTDKWYELNYSPENGWEARVRDVRRNLAQVASDARFVIAGRELAVFIPVSEFNIPAPTFRVTAFCHTGDFGLKGGPWSGDYFPPVNGPLLPVAGSDSVIVINQ
jgi:hypothetical protein